MESFVKRGPWGPGLFFLNSAIGLMMLCFPMLAMVLLVLITVLEALLAYNLMRFLFKVRIRFRTIMAVFVLANIVSTIAGFFLLFVSAGSPLVNWSSSATPWVVFGLCFALSVVTEATVILFFIPSNVGNLKAKLMTIGRIRSRKDSDSVLPEMAFCILAANVASYCLLLMFPLAYCMTKDHKMVSTISTKPPFKNRDDQKYSEPRDSRMFQAKTARNNIAMIDKP